MLLGDNAGPLATVVVMTVAGGGAGEPTNQAAGRGRASGLSIFWAAWIREASGDKNRFQLNIVLVVNLITGDIIIIIMIVVRLVSALKYGICIIKDL